METVQGLSIFELAYLARAQLVRARIAKQEAVVQSELDFYYQEIGGTFSKTEALLVKAQQLRRTAREAMKEIEIINGRRYLEGIWTSPLRFLINGKAFREWDCYRVEYANHKLFQGVDPS